jgi:hypothetical protein
LELDSDTVWLVLRSAVTLVALLLLAFTAFSLLSGEDPGSILITDSDHLISWDTLWALGLFASLIWLFGFGAFSLAWFFPEFTEEDEGLSRFGAALTLGLVGAGLLYQLASNINKLFWNQVGQREIANDVKRNFGKLVERGPETVLIIDELIAEIEDKRRKYESEAQRISNDRRIDFLLELRKQAD